MLDVQFGIQHKSQEGHLWSPFSESTSSTISVLLSPCCCWRKSGLPGGTIEPLQLVGILPSSDINGCCTFSSNRITYQLIQQTKYFKDM